MLFVSYSSKDEESVRQLVQDLDRARFDVWLDEELRGGDVWWDEILGRIRSSDVFLFALSTNSRQSKPCRAELQYARALGLPVLPVQIGPVDSIRTLPISDLQIVQYGDRTVANAMALVAAVQETSRIHRTPPDPLPEPPAVPYAYLLRLSTAIEAPTLSIDEQADLVRQLRGGLEDEEEESVREDIRTLLRALRRRNDLTVRNAGDIDALLAPVGVVAAAAAERHEDAPAAVAARPVEPLAPAAPLPERVAVPAGWYRDPTGEAGLRYWDGETWTGHTARGAEARTDAAPPPPARPTPLPDAAAYPPPDSRHAGGAQQTTQGNGWSVAAIILGCVAFLTAGITAIPALVCAFVAKAKHERSATAGIVVAVIGTILTVVLYAVVLSSGGYYSS